MEALLYGPAAQMSCVPPLECCPSNGEKRAGLQFGVLITLEAQIATVIRRAFYQLKLTCHLPPAVIVHALVNSCHTL